MTDTDKLKRLAEEVLSNSLPVCAEYTLAQGILAPIAENERLSGCLCEANKGTEHFERNWYLVCHERDEAVALLRKWLLAPVCAVGLTSIYGDTESFLSRVDAKETK